MAEINKASTDPQQLLDDKVSVGRSSSCAVLRDVGVNVKVLKLHTSSSRELAAATTRPVSICIGLPGACIRTERRVSC